jgi:hypothetical protein
VLLGAVDPNAFFTTDVAAEAALNLKLGTTGIDYFSFA